MQNSLITNYLTAKSVCQCGHSGDGLKSEHGDRPYSNGHGACKVPGCNCDQFTWLAWTPAFESLLRVVKSLERGDL